MKMKLLRVINNHQCYVDQTQAGFIVKRNTVLLPVIMMSVKITNNILKRQK